MLHSFRVSIPTLLVGIPDIHKFPTVDFVNVMVFILVVTGSHHFVNLDQGFGSSTSKFNWFFIQQWNFQVPEHLT